MDKIKALFNEVKWKYYHQHYGYDDNQTPEVNEKLAQYGEWVAEEYAEEWLDMAYPNLTPEEKNWVMGKTKRIKRRKRKQCETE